MELLKSEVLKNNDTFRFDSEFFKKEYLENKNIIESCEHESLENLTTLITNGHTPLKADLSSGDIKFITAEFIQDFIFLDVSKYISKKDNIVLNRSRLFENDIIFTIKGKVANAVPIFNKKEELNINQDVARLVLNNKQSCFYITSFLNSKYGKLQSKHISTGQINPFIALGSLKKLKIPMFSQSFQKAIEKLVKQAHENLDTSKTLYREAEALLLAEVGLQHFQPSKEKVSIKSLSESFGASGRLDAEYYQPKYENILNKIKSHKFNTLKNIVDITKSIEPGSNAYSEAGLPFMRVSDFSKHGINKTNKFLKDDFVDANSEKLENLTPKKRTILFSKDGTVGIAYHLREDYKAITSGAILHLKVKTKEILPEYLTLVLNSELVQKQAERDAGGSIIQHWRVSEIEQVLIPIIPIDKQTQIAEKIEQSFALKKESERLSFFLCLLSVARHMNGDKMTLDWRKKSLTYLAASTLFCNSSLIGLL